MDDSPAPEAMRFPQAVLLTPVGRGAVATVLVEGAGVTAAVGRYFQPAAGRVLSDIPFGQITFGTWQSESGSAEELVVCCKSPQHVEVHCHGGVAAAESILASLAAVGFKTLDWRTWAGLTEFDPITAEARVSLASARTERAARVLLDQFQGALRAAMVAAAAACEAGDAERAKHVLERVLRHERVGQHLTIPWRVVLAGPPNVGKSSLINALVGYERSIVFDQPGTTRDVLSVHSAIDGWPVEFSDTAGLREAEGDIEAQGVARAREQIETADLVLLVFDASQDWTAAEQSLVDSHPAALVVLNKCDLPMSNAVGNALRGVPGLFTSAKTGEGIDELLHEISHRLVPEPPLPGEAVPFARIPADILHLMLERIQNGELALAAEGLRGNRPSPVDRQANAGDKVVVDEM